MDYLTKYKNLVLFKMGDMIHTASEKSQLFFTYFVRYFEVP